MKGYLDYFSIFLGLRKENLLHAWNSFPSSPRQLIQYLFTLYLTISVQYQFWDTYYVKRQLETVQLETGNFMKHRNGTGEAFKNQLMNSLWCHSNLENPWQITVARMLPYICTDPLFSTVFFFGFDVIGFLCPPCDVKRDSLSVCWWWIKKRLGQGHPASECQNSHEKPG